MNESEVQILKDKITKCDITIHIQQLGTQWVPEQVDEQKDNQARKCWWSLMLEGYNLFIANYT